MFMNQELILQPCTDLLNQDLLFISQFESCTKCNFRSPNGRKHNGAMQRSEVIRIHNADPYLFPKTSNEFIVTSSFA